MDSNNILNRQICTFRKLGYEWIKTQIFLTALADVNSYTIRPSDDPRKLVNLPNRLPTIKNDTPICVLLNPLFAAICLYLLF